MSDQPFPNVQREISDVLEEARDGISAPEKLDSLMELLAARSEARRYYLETNLLIAALATDDAPPTDRVEAKPSPRHRFVTSRIGWTLAATALLAAVLGIVYLGNANVPSGEVIATIEELSGHATVTTAGAETRAVTANLEIRSGETIRTQGTLSSVVIGFCDDTQLSVVGDSSLTISDDGQKSVVFHGGTLFASVTPQPSGKPLIVATPQDRVQVMGTRFSLDATRAFTDMSVSEGRVLLTRLSDGQTIEVPAGRRVVSRNRESLVAKPIPALPATWGEDFEQGLPERWMHGKMVAAGLPPESQGGVRAVEVATDEGPRWQIASQDRWTLGLFPVHDDTQLHIRLKMADTGWFNILILTKTSDADPPTFAGNYIYDKPAWFGQPNEWGEITIPLSEFRPLPPSREAFAGAIPIQIVLSSPDKDRGLVIDRIWVDRAGGEKQKGNVEQEQGQPQSKSEPSI